MKLITSAIALIGLLAACNAGATTPSEQTLPSLGGSGEVMTSPSASAAGGSCADAFAAIDLTAISSTTDLMSLSDELDATISSCPTVAEWTTALHSRMPTVDTTRAEAFVQQRCAENATLASTELCAQVGS